ncbi:hypothetical protein CVD28_11050 [Bacillus sp. M6-12]|uniref:hypothetical protein n=1 Tax=Bacillus sp. M6-12 TaxID=2054166 RepID=UPI000C771A61|nr:hypothetical protein [Bacillus sp. M6-12]PLS17530.1 hypothetical protein CVD28_11050 [Bacillus sp. M6-12]
MKVDWKNNSEETPCHCIMLIGRFCWSAGKILISKLGGRFTIDKLITKKFAKLSFYIDEKVCSLYDKMNVSEVEI